MFTGLCFDETFTNRVNSVSYYSSPHVENCATVGYEAIDYFSTGVFGKSQLDRNLVSSKRQGNGLQSNGGQLQPNIVGEGEQRCIFGGSGIIGNAAVVDHFGQMAERPPSKR